MCQCLHIIEICIYTTACVSNTIVFLPFFLKTNLIFLQRVPFFLFEDKKAATHPSSSLLIRRTFIFRVLFWLMAKNPSREKRKTKEPKSSSDRNSDGARENALRRSRVTRVTYRKGRALWAHTFLRCKGIESCPHPFLLPLPRACAAHRHTIIIIEERRRRRRRRRHHRRSCLPKVVLFVLPLLLPLARAPLATAR